MKKEKINFRAVKVGKKPIKIKFWTKEGKEVTFKGYKTFLKKII